MSFAAQLKSERTRLGLTTSDVCFLAVSTYRQAKQAAPWAAKIARCEGGYMAFRFVKEHAQWLRQK